MVPVLLLTGFLGSGKTTLLNRLLEERPRKGPFAETTGKLALIVNEFGDVGIDGDLLPDEMTRQVEIKGGCICCRLDEDLEKTLRELVDSQPDLSAIIIETTGIAEPLPISWTLAKEELASRMRLAAVITVVDALEHERHRPMSPSVDAQVEYADILVVTKLDLAGPEGLREVQGGLRDLNKMAPVFAGDTSTLVAELWRTLDDPSFETQERAPGSASHESSHSFQSMTLPIKHTLDFEELTEMLESLPPSYIRIKGIAMVVDGASGNTVPHMVAFHRVGARVSCEPVSDELATRLVAIGTNMNEESLAECISEAVVR